MVSWLCAINHRCFAKEHLSLIMVYEYSSNSRHCVFAYNNVAEEMAQKKAWSHLGGAPPLQVVHPEESRCTGKPVGQ